MTIYDDIPDGVHRCRFRSATKGVSKSGNEIIRITIEVYGYDKWLTHHVVFLPHRPEITGRQIQEIVSSAPDIPDIYDLWSWIGRECACDIMHDDWQGRQVPKVATFVPASAQGRLPHFARPGDGVIVCDAVCGEA